MTCHRKAHNLNEKERTEDIKIEEMVDFSGMYLADPVLKGLKKAGFVRPSPIQLSAIPLGRCGLDLIVQAKSGTGKTLVFTIVALEMINTNALSTQVLVIAPTREIAVQITQVINAVGSAVPNLKAATFIGGTDLAADKDKLKCCHIVVGTPGRLAQLVEQGALILENVRLLVFDEADQLLKQDSLYCTIMQLYSLLPHSKQVLSLSATYTDEIAERMSKLMRSPNHVRLGKDAPSLLGVKQFATILPNQLQLHKRHQAKVIKLMSVLSVITFNQCLVFTNSQMKAESIYNQLKASGWSVSLLHGSQPQQERLNALDALCNYKCRILVSTDLSARGLDSEHVNLVINLDIPWDYATYLHRVGRAGRFGSKGYAISIVSEVPDLVTIRAIATLANIPINIANKNNDLIEIANEESQYELIEYLEEEELNKWLTSQSNKNNSNLKLNGSKDDENNSSGIEIHNPSTSINSARKTLIELWDKSTNYEIDSKPISFAEIYKDCCENLKNIKEEEVNEIKANYIFNPLGPKEKEYLNHLIETSCSPNLDVTEDLIYEEEDLKAMLNDMILGKKPSIRKSTENGRANKVNKSNNETAHLTNGDLSTNKDNETALDKKKSRANKQKTKESESDHNKTLICSKSAYVNGTNGHNDLIEDVTNRNSLTNGKKDSKKTKNKSKPKSKSTNYENKLSDLETSKSTNKSNVNQSYEYTNGHASNYGYSPETTPLYKNNTYNYSNYYNGYSNEANTNSYNYEKYQSHKYYAEPGTSSDYNKQKTRSDRRTSSNRSYNYYQKYDSKYAEYNNYPAYNNTGYNNYPEYNKYTNDSYSEYQRHTQYYIDSAVKFSSMMNYVQSVGKMSHYMAQQFKSNNKKK